MKNDEQLQDMMLVALRACAIEFAGFDYEGKDDPKSTAARLVFGVFQELKRSSGE